MDADVYLRLSQDRKGEELGIDRQRSRATSMLNAREWSLGREHIDNDRSAAGEKARPAFDQMMQRVEAGKVQAIIAWSLDRLLRNRYDQLRLFEEAEKHKIRICLIEGSDLDMSTAAGQLVADVLAAQARSEIKLKAKRQEDAQVQAAYQGRRVGGRKRFGYELDGVTVIPDEAAAVSAAFSDVLAGVSLGAIARRWNEAGLFSGQTHYRDTKKGGKKGELTRWTHDTVRLVLSNPAYMGRRRYKGEEVADAEWPAIVSEQTFRTMEGFLSQPKRRSGGSGQHGQRLLTGEALCGVCGYTVHSGRGQRAARGYSLYRCSQSGGHISRKLDPIDEYVSELVIARMSRPDAVDLLVDEQRPDMEALRAKARRLRTKRDTLAIEYAESEDMTAKQLRLATENLTRQLHELEEQMADAGREDVLGDLARAEDTEAAWEAMTVARQRAVVHHLMTVTILPIGRGVRTFRPESVEVVPKR